VIAAKGKPISSPSAVAGLSPVAVPHAPTKYTSQIILRGVGRPDDLAFDQSGRVLFSDEMNGTLSRVNVDGSVTILLHDAAGPEGMVVLQDGTLVFAEQDSNQIVALAPGETTPRVLRALPGKSSTVTCKHGVDGIAFDPTTRTLIIPDSPTGDVYRMSLDGKTLTLLASGIVRPVGAGVDADGIIYIADECGHAVWSVTPGGKVTRIPGFGMPDDVVPDGYGNLLVVDLEPAIHALIRLNLATGKRETLASPGFIEPQGLLVDAQGNIYVSDDYANLIMKFLPV
jgi:sugar lactone lactonase YvrE